MTLGEILRGQHTAVTVPEEWGYTDLTGKAVCDTCSEQKQMAGFGYGVLYPCETIQALDLHEAALTEARGRAEAAEAGQAVLAEVLERIGNRLHAGRSDLKMHDAAVKAGEMAHTALANLPAAVKAAQERTAKLEALVATARALSDVLDHGIENLTLLKYRPELLMAEGYAGMLRRDLQALKPAGASPERASDAPPESREQEGEL